MIDSIDSSLIRGLALILMILAFLGIWAWAWSRNRKEDFREASMLPLDDDDDQMTQNASDKDRKQE